MGIPAPRVINVAPAVASDNFLEAVEVIIKLIAPLKVKLDGENKLKSLLAYRGWSRDTGKSRN